LREYLDYGSYTRGDPHGCLLACHPFYTGEQRIVDTAGQVERFMRRLEKRGGTAEQVDTEQVDA
jgi:hypothetical protein